MITHIRMKNFKSWKDSGEVKLAPLTGFFGTNSSGKSSLLQMLLLLKQTAERSNAEEVIFFGDDNSLVNLGSFSEVIHGHNVEESLALEFRCEFQVPRQIRITEKSEDYPNSILLGVLGFNFRSIMKQEEGELKIKDFWYKNFSFNNY
ncbi:AAA family ATPase, partial [Candidatus Poribacteria bacterium]|nr:AAA family ATPase [Candidatus Poribacteria bacterium]